MTQFLTSSQGRRETLLATLQQKSPQVSCLERKFPTMAFLKPESSCYSPESTCILPLRCLFNSLRRKECPECRTLMLEACAQTHFVPLQDSLYIVNNSLLTTSQGAQCPYSLHTWHRFELGGSCTHSWQVTQALPRGHAGHLHLGNNNNKEKPPSTAAVATGTQGQGKRNIIGLPSSAISLPRVCNYQSDCSPG